MYKTSYGNSLVKAQRCFAVGATGAKQILKIFLKEIVASEILSNIYRRQEILSSMDMIYQSTCHENKLTIVTYSANPSRIALSTRDVGSFFNTLK